MLQPEIPKNIEKKKTWNAKYNYRLRRGCLFVDVSGMSQILQVLWINFGRYIETIQFGVYTIMFTCDFELLEETISGRNPFRAEESIRKPKARIGSQWPWWRRGGTTRNQNLTTFTANLTKTKKVPGATGTKYPKFREVYPKMIVGNTRASHTDEQQEKSKKGNYQYQQLAFWVVILIPSNKNTSLPNLLIPATLAFTNGIRRLHQWDSLNAMSSCIYDTKNQQKSLA